MSNSDFTGETTDALVAAVKADMGASQRELAVLDRLVGALDEIDTLTRETVGLMREIEKLREARSG